MDAPILHPVIPYVGPLPSSVLPGKCVRILGVPESTGTRFSCSLQSGPSNSDDIALNVSVNLVDGIITTSHQEFGKIVEGDTYKNSQILRGAQFEIRIICEHTVYKIGVNGKHLCEFPQKIPYYRATYLNIEGNVQVSQISVESEQLSQQTNMNSPPPPYPATAPAPGHMPYPPNVNPQFGFAAQPSYPPPLNAGPQVAVYSNPNQYPPGQYVHNPLLQAQPVSGAALNATPRVYQRPFWSGGYYRGSRKATYIGLGIYCIFTVVILTTFLAIFFTVFNKHNKDWEEAQKRHEEFRNKHFPDW